MSENSILQKKNLQELFSHIYLPLTQKLSLFAPKKKVIVIAGPTASGKTDLSIELAKIVGGEIVSADSMQIYKEMDIGTAKISQEIRRDIPHHLIDIADVHESFNVADYFQVASEAIEGIISRGNVPIVVGGSGFYIHALLYGPPLGPKSDPKIRAKLEQKMEKIGCAAMYEQLQLLDPKYAEMITEKDRHKIIRALEIMTISEKKVSDFKKPVKMKNDLYDFRLWFMHYSLPTLYHKIEKRCMKMVKDGLVQEVEKLSEKGLEKNSVPGKAIGYKQCLEYLETAQTKEDFEWFLYEFKKASRHLAKRQFTWFRKAEFFRWIDLEKISLERAKEWILQDYEQGR